MEQMKIGQNLNLQKLFHARGNDAFYASLYPKRSPWRVPLDSGDILRTVYRVNIFLGRFLLIIGYHDLMACGIIKQSFGRWLPEEVDPTGQTDGTNTLDLLQTGAAFLLYGFLTVAAVAIFTYERCCSTWKKMEREAKEEMEGEAKEKRQTKAVQPDNEWWYQN